MGDEPGYGLFDSDMSSESDSSSSSSSEDEKEESQRGKKKEKKKMKKKKEKEKKEKKSEEGNENCVHFLNNRCHHGFSGKKPFEGVKKCPYVHPTICKKWAANGNHEGGCNLGKKCSELHVKICRTSLKNRICDKIGSDSRCMGGYHLKGTKGQI